MQEVPRLGAGQPHHAVIGQQIFVEVCGVGDPVDARVPGAPESVEQVFHHIAVAVGEEFFDVLDPEGSMLRKSFNHGAHSWSLSSSRSPAGETLVHSNPRSRWVRWRNVSEEAFV